MTEPAIDMASSTVGAAMGLIGDSWTLLILQRAFLGVRRFSEWRAALGISDSVLADRLREMTVGGLLQPEPYRDGGRTRLEYRLSPAGRDLWSFYVAVWSWERAWVPRTLPLPALVHAGCGQPTDVVLTCGACGVEVGARDTAATRAPGLAFRNALPPRLHPRRSRAALPSDPLSWFPGALEILGDRWSTAVLAGAFLGLRSFTEFRRDLEVSPDVLSDRLRRFVDHGVLVAAPDGYRLAAKGHATFPILMTLMSWGDRWLASDACRPALWLEHRACGARFEPTLRCRGCGRVLERRAVHFEVPAAS